MRILFILKKKEDSYGGGDYGQTEGDRFNGSMSTGLLNSVRFVVDALNSAPHGLYANLVVVNDNNDIDREVTRFKPDVVIIEALWVVPEKFDVLVPLHPTVKWVVRLHSAIPFIANEGIAMKWTLAYLTKRNVYVSCNDSRILASLRTLVAHVDGWVGAARILYQPNCYEGADRPLKPRSTSGPVNVGCFGAIRPMKNQLAQAVAAIAWADSLGRPMNFNINAGRVEMKGSPVLHNLQALFADPSVMARGHHLAERPWLSHDDFLDLCAQMDVGMQVSNSETFNIVAADMVTVGVPVVGSPEISWLPRALQADPSSQDSMVRGLRRAWRHSKFAVKASRGNLGRLSARNLDAWISSLEFLVPFTQGRHRR